MEGGFRTYRGVRLDRAIESHRRPALLCDLRILTMESALLVLLHACNLLLQSFLSYMMKFQQQKKNGRTERRGKGDDQHTASLLARRDRCRPLALACLRLSSRPR